jgi:hypothetical protein
LAGNQSVGCAWVAGRGVVRRWLAVVACAGLPPPASFLPSRRNPTKSTLQHVHARTPASPTHPPLSACSPAVRIRRDPGAPPIQRPGEPRRAAANPSPQGPTDHARGGRSMPPLFFPAEGGDSWRRDSEPRRRRGSVVVHGVPVWLPVNSGGRWLRVGGEGRCGLAHHGSMARRVFGLGRSTPLH